MAKRCSEYFTCFKIGGRHSGFPVHRQQQGPERLRYLPVVAQLVGVMPGLIPGCGLQDLGSSPLGPRAECPRNVSSLPPSPLPTFHMHLPLFELIDLSIRMYEEGQWDIGGRGRGRGSWGAECPGRLEIHLLAAQFSVL